MTQIFREGTQARRSSAPGGGRTHNLWLRRPTLYPVELRARETASINRKIVIFHLHFGLTRLKVSALPARRLVDYKPDHRSHRKRAAEGRRHELQSRRQRPGA